MSDAASPAKVCIVCKQDCSKKPRSKDEQGRYTCKPCQEKRAAQAAAAKARPAAKPSTTTVTAPAFDDGADNDFMSKLVESSPVASAPPCPGCNMPMTPGAVVCMACGYNSKTGQRIAVSVAKAPKEPSKAAGLAGAAAAGAAKGTVAILMPIVGGVVGGAIGAAIWTLVAYQTRYEIGWIAWGVGVLTGIGVAAGARGSVGPITGLVAAVISLAAVCGGRYAAISMLVDDFAGKITQNMHYTVDMAIGETATTVVNEWKAAGKKLNWPEGMDPEDAALASEESEFPTEVWAEATKRWSARSDADRTRFIAAKDSELRSDVSARLSSIKERGFVESIGLFDILFMLLAVASAYGVASGASAGD